ncbi:hypothetical protein GCM10009869_31480 [Amnibacterium kyonggiense]
MSVEFEMRVPGHPEPTHVIRRLKLQGSERFRVVTWAPRSEGRELVGYFDSGDAAAEAAWRRYCDAAASQHELASRTHGGAERGGPAATR